MREKMQLKGGYSSLGYDSRRCGKETKNIGRTAQNRKTGILEDLEYGNEIKINKTSS